MKKTHSVKISYHVKAKFAERKTKLRSAYDYTNAQGTAVHVPALYQVRKERVRKSYDVEYVRTLSLAPAPTPAQQPAPKIQNLAKIPYIKPEPGSEPLDIGRFKRQVKKDEPVRLLIRSTWYKPLKGKKRKRSLVSKHHESGSNEYIRNIHMGSQDVRVRMFYVNVTKAMLGTEGFEEYIRRELHKQFNEFNESSFNSFTSSVQLLAGPVRNFYTSQMDTEKGEASRAAYFPAMSKKLKKGARERSEKTKQTIAHNNIETLIGNLVSLYQYGLIEAMTRKEYDESQEEKTDIFGELINDDDDDE